jgi:hypothetical protein
LGRPTDNDRLIQMTTKYTILSASRPGLGSVVVVDDTAQLGTRALSNIGIEDNPRLTGTPAPGAAQMDGQANVAVTGTTGIVHSGAAQMDGSSSVAFTGTLVSRGAAQMDGLATVDFRGAVGSGIANMDGVATVAFAGIVTGGFGIGAAEMDGVATVSFKGAVSRIVSGAAHMDGVGSMLAVTIGPPLPPHGILLAAGM